MFKVGLLDFLSKVNHISVLNCSSDFEYVKDIFDVIFRGKYHDSEIDLGIIYVKKNSDKEYIIIDGKRRILALSLLLSAIAEYHSNISPTVSVLANQINLRYLKYTNDPKLSLFGLEKTVYEKIINKEPLSYNEKQTELYITYDMLLQNIKNLDFDIDQFYDLIIRVKVNIIFIDEFSDRDIFYTINKDLRQLNQLMLIKSYLAESHHSEIVDNLYFFFNYKIDLFLGFLKAYLSPKFSTLIEDDNQIYDYFVKYIENIKKYQNFEEIILGFTRTAKIYRKMNSADYRDPDVKNMFIKIISSEGRDMFAYLLELCEDYENGYLPKESFIEVGNILNTFLQERMNSSKLQDNFDFSILANELNKVIYDDNASN